MQVLYPSYLTKKRKEKNPQELSACTFLYVLLESEMKLQPEDNKSSFQADVLLIRDSWKLEISYLSPILKCLQYLNV